MAATLIGRDEELGSVRAALGSLPATVVLEGEAGIGKTSVWRAALVELEARGARVLSARPAEAESQLSYAGLADILDPVVDEALTRLPPPQRRALEVALKRADPAGAPPDQAAVAFAILGALRTAAERDQLVVAVDDVQWLDQPSLDALAFIERRLRGDRIGFLLTRRLERRQVDLQRQLGEERVRVIHLGPLSLGALHHLLRTQLATTLSRPSLQRVHEASGGNPLFALELARVLRRRDGEPRAGEPLPVPGTLEELLHGRFAALPRKAEEPLLFAAAMSQPTVAFVASAMEADPARSLRRAVEAGLIELEGKRIRFTHPLFASVVYSRAGGDRRREIHRRLAAIVADPEQHARHLALAATGPDSAVASALENAARSARARGAPQAAAELGDLALRLTPDDENESAQLRRLEAGAAHFEAGDTAQARELFAEAADNAGSGPLRVAALVRLARVHHYAGDQRLAVALFRECLADRRAGLDVRIDAADGLANSLFFLRQELTEALSHARSAARLARKAGDVDALAVTLGTRGMLEAVLGHPQSLRTLRSAVALERSGALSVPLIRRPRFQLAFSRVWSDDVAAARATLEGVRKQAVSHGDEGSLPFILSYLGLAECLSGHFEDGMRAADEGEEVARTAGQEIGHAFALSARALAASFLGREHAARRDADEALGLAERGTMFAQATSLWALGLLELSLDNPREAHRRLGPLVDRVEAAGIGEPGSIRFVTDDVEALVALGELEAAAARLDSFQERARRIGRSSALAAAYRCRGLIAMATPTAGEASREFARALDKLDGLSLPFERARTLLALGSAQRKAGQRRVARQTLEHALAAFDELAASLWSARTRRELTRISGRSPSRGELTATERRVAELVAEGRTNREVAAALYVAPRTVEGTLSRIYSKLGVRSRTELARHLVDRRSGEPHEPKVG